MPTDMTAPLTLLDHNIRILLQDPDQTASRKDGVPPGMERLHRLHGTSVMFQVSRLLCLGASTFATACVMFHRFYYQASLKQYNVWSTSMACILLATKIEEEENTVCSLKALIQVYAHVYRKRILVVNNANIHDESTDFFWKHPCLCHLPQAEVWSLNEKERRLAQLDLPGSMGPVFSEWHQQVSRLETCILRQLGFTLYWIPDSHPHKYILYFCQVLEIVSSEERQVAQRAWNYCNDACRLDLCVRVVPQVTACSAIMLAARDFGLDLPLTPAPWWEVFVGEGQGVELTKAANAIAGLCLTFQKEQDAATFDVLVASRGFVKSMVAETSGSKSKGVGFNDPGSFLWEHQQSALEDFVSVANDGNG